MPPMPPCLDIFFTCISLGMLPYQKPALILLRRHNSVFTRWLALHNSSLSVTDVINQINRPSEKQSYQAAALTSSTSVYGSTENFVQYLKYGKLCSTDNSGMLTLTSSRLGLV